MSSRCKQSRGWFVVWRTPIGLMRSRVTEDGWLELEFPNEDERILPPDMQLRVSVAALGSPAADAGEPPPQIHQHVEEMQSYLDGYFCGELGRPLPRIDNDQTTEFTRAVRKALMEIPAGCTITYGQLADIVNRRHGARAVGQVMARNALVLIVPCHRVLAGGRGMVRLGGFSGGLELKRWLLDHESRHCRRSGTLTGYPVDSPALLS